MSLRALGVGAGLKKNVKVGRQRRKDGGRRRPLSTEGAARR